MQAYSHTSNLGKFMKRIIERVSFALLAFSLLSVSLRAAEGAVIDSMDDVSTFAAPKEKGSLKAVDGKVGKAIEFTFADQCSGIFFTGKARATPEWDKAAGFSFWVKGDGSDHFGGLQFIYGEDYAIRYTYAFPIDNKDWKKITVAWSDLVSVLSHDPAEAFQPSKLSGIWVGKWFFWKDYGAHTFAIDDVRLEPVIELDKQDYKPAGDPLARVMAKLKAGKPVTIVTMGDSLTDYGHWANKNVNWPTLLKTQLKEKYKSDVTIVNPAIGGTELRQGTALIPRWVKTAPEPDLVTVFYGFNDFAGGMHGPMFEKTYSDTIDRIRRATHGKSDVLVMCTAPAASKWDDMAEMAEACRKAADAKHTGLCDIYAIFHEAGKAGKDQFYVDDKTHMAEPGHRLIAKSVQEAIEKGK